MRLVFKIWSVAFTKYLKKYLGNAASMLINVVKEERNVWGTSHINGKWQFRLHIPVQQSSAWKKKIRTGDFVTLPTPKFYQISTCYYKCTFLIRRIVPDTTRSFSEIIPGCFTLPFCHNYFLKAVVWRQTFWWVTLRCPGTAVTPLSFLKWKLRSSRAPHDPKPPSNLLRGPPCTQGPRWGEDHVFPADDKPVSFQCGRRAESSGILFQRVKWEERTKKKKKKKAGGRECSFPGLDPPGSLPVPLRRPARLPRLRAERQRSAPAPGARERPLPEPGQDPSSPLTETRTARSAGKRRSLQRCMAARPTDTEPRTHSPLPHSRSRHPQLLLRRRGRHRPGSGAGPAPRRSGRRAPGPLLTAEPGAGFALWAEIKEWVLWCCSGPSIGAPKGAYGA